MDANEICQFISACKNGEMDVIDRLIGQGINVNCKYKGTSALRTVCKSTEPWVIDVVTKLITHGADVDYEDPCGFNALDEVLGQDLFNVDLAYLLLDCSKLGINRTDKNGRNYLWATETIESCKFLIDNGIDINHVDNRPETYIDGPECIRRQYLIERGAKKYADL